MRAYELAKDLGVDTKLVVTIASTHGYEVRSASSRLSSSVQEAIRAAVSRQADASPERTIHQAALATFARRRINSALGGHYEPCLPDDLDTIHVVDTRTLARDGETIDGVHYTHYQGQRALCGKTVKVRLPLSLKSPNDCTCETCNYRVLNPDWHARQHEEHARRRALDPEVEAAPDQRSAKIWTSETGSPSVQTSQPIRGRAIILDDIGQHD